MAKKSTHSGSEKIFKPSSLVPTKFKPRMFPIPPPPLPVLRGHSLRTGTLFVYCLRGYTQAFYKRGLHLLWLQGTGNYTFIRAHLGLYTFLIITTSNLQLNRYLSAQTGKWPLQGFVFIWYHALCYHGAFHYLIVRSCSFFQLFSFHDSLQNHIKFYEGERKTLYQ